MLRKHFHLNQNHIDFLSNYENESEIIRRALDEYIDRFNSNKTAKSASKSLSEEKGGEDGK